MRLVSRDPVDPTTPINERKEDSDDDLTMGPAHYRGVRSLLVLTVLPFLLVGSTKAAEGAEAKCSPVPQPANPGNFTLVCASGRAVVKAKSGVSYRFRGSHCFYGPRGARLYFGAGWPDGPRLFSINVSPPRPRGSRGAEIDDGVLKLRAAGRRSWALVGTARLTDGLRRGTFTVVEHLGAGVTGTRTFTGSWNCGGR